VSNLTKMREMWATSYWVESGGTSIREAAPWVSAIVIPHDRYFKLGLIPSPLAVDLFQHFSSRICTSRQQARILADVWVKYMAGRESPPKRFMATECLCGVSAPREEIS